MMRFRQNIRRLGALLSLSLSLCVLGCQPAAKPSAAPPVAIDFRKPLPEGMVALRKIGPEEYPDFSAQPIDPAALGASIDNSLKYLSAASSKSYFPYLDITHERAFATLQRLRAICDEVQSSGWDAAKFGQHIRNEFDVYKSYGAPSPDGLSFTDQVLFTGYCTPIYDASFSRLGEYQWPLYKLPADLDRDPMTGDVHGRKTADGQLVPYYTRHDIEVGGRLAGDELVYLKSRWEAYVVTIQGSARLRMQDTGKIYEIGFAGTNGYPYTSPGMQMLADGVITRDQLSLRGLTAFFASHPEMTDKYLSIDQRDVFFTERPGGPFGKLNVPVTPLATIATDKARHDIYPRAMPAFVITAIPEPSGLHIHPFSGFLLDQDTGGGIRASGRCDIYMGIGSTAEAMAGSELQQGQLYYLAVKPEFMAQPADIGIPTDQNAPKP